MESEVEITVEAKKADLKRSKNNKHKKSKRSKKKSKKRSRSSSSSSSSSSSESSEESDEDEPQAKVIMRYRNPINHHNPPATPSRLVSTKATPLPNTPRMNTSSPVHNTLARAASTPAIRRMQEVEGVIASPHRLFFTPQQQLVSRTRKETPRDSESEDDVMIDGKESDKTNEDEDEVEDFRPDGTVLELHGGKQGLSLVLYNVKREFNIPGALEEGVVRASVADGENYTTNIFFNNEISKKVEEDFTMGKTYAVKFVHTGVFVKATHCVNVVEYEKVGEKC